MIGRFFTSVRFLCMSSPRSIKLNGKTAVVTASTDGIGFAVAQKLGLDGAHVVISSRKQDKVDSAKATLKKLNISVSGEVCHVTDSVQRTALLNKIENDFGGLDILVLNAGVNPYFGPTLNTPEEAYDKIFNTNVKSTFLWIQQAVPLMKNRKNASITVVSSIAAFAPFQQLGVYSMSKTALVAMTKTFCSELGVEGIRINCVAPGVIKTKFSSALWKNTAMEKSILEKVPVGRLGTVEDCSGIVSFLSSDESSYITGETFIVAGGMQSRM